MSARKVTAPDKTAHARTAPAMTALDKLAASAGNWSGTSALQDPEHNVKDESPSEASIKPMLFGRFVRIDYIWAYHGKPQEGSLLLGFQKDANVVTAHWIDTWHMNDKVMSCEGKSLPDGSVSLRGSYAAPPGPDWGWRIDLEPDGRQLRMVMYNVAPDGREELAVDASYARA